MGAPLHLVALNPVFSPDVEQPASLLARYATLTGWARALRDAGAHVIVVQRFSADAHFEHDGIRYRLVRDDGPAFPAPAWASSTLVARIAALGADVVHVNGLMFPGILAALRAALPSRTAIVVQDHAGYDPPGAARRLVHGAVWRAGFEAVDACSFTAVEQAEPWIHAGLLDRARVVTALESSTTLQPQDRQAAGASTGVRASPAILWIGRLEPNKDPLTVLDGVSRAIGRLPDARLWMIYQSGSLEDAVRRRVARAPALSDRVTLLGAQPHDRIASYLSAADLYVSGSHREGSGYALIEAMACGAVPVVTDIPSFRAITGECGHRWPPGDATALSAAIVQAADAQTDAPTPPRKLRSAGTPAPTPPRKLRAAGTPAARQRVRDRFARELSWDAIGRRTLSLYADLSARRRGAP